MTSQDVAVESYAAVDLDIDPSSALRLRELRRERGLSATQVAGMLSVSPSSIHRWERGARLPGPVHLRALADAFDVPLADIVRSVDTHRPPPARASGLPGRGLRALRRARGLSAASLAAALGVPAHHVYNWEHGRCRIPMHYRKPLASALSVSEIRLPDLLTWAPSPPRLREPCHPIAAMRIRSGLSQVSAADRLGVSRWTLRRWERGERPTLAGIRGMAGLYNLPISHVAKVAGVVFPSELDPSTWSPGQLPGLLRVLRDWSGLTQRALAARVGAALATVRGWESGRIQPGDHLRRRLEQVFRLPEGALLAAYS